MLAVITEVERPLRLGNVARLRALVGDYGDEVTVVSAHDRGSSPPASGWPPTRFDIA